MKPSSSRLTISALTALAAIGFLPAQDSTAQQLEQQERRLNSMESSLKSMQSENQGAWVGYDKGYVIKSRDGAKNPFYLRINARMQYRYSGFAESENSFSNLGTNTTGTNQPVRVQSRSDFEIERGRLSFAGSVIDPKLHFYINIDADTDDNHEAIFHDFWVNYDFTKDASVYIGKAFVPGSRSWLDGSKGTHFADRSVATTFFRPDRTVGIWVIGKASENVKYRVMFGNGARTSDLNRNQVNRDPMLSATTWWEPNGKFGKGYSDIKVEDKARTRFGASVTYSEQSGRAANGSTFAESNGTRLDDGTRLTSLGVDTFDMLMFAVDAAVKYKGFSMHGEAYYRQLDNIRPTAPQPGGFPWDDNTSYGGYVAAGYMLVPNKSELVFMTSTVQGDFKDTWEYGLAFNWYVNGTHNNKITLDVITINGSPISNSGPNYRAGDDGTMVRVQHQIGF